MSKSPNKTVRGSVQTKKIPHRSVTEVDELEEWRKGKQLAKPRDQVELSEAELKENITKQLCSANPLPADSLVEFSYAEGCFLPLPPSPHTIVVFEYLGTQLHKDSEEARAQLIEQGIDPDTYEPEEEEEEKLPEEAAAPVPKPVGEDGEEKEDKDEEEEEVKPEKEEEPEEEGEAEGEAKAKAEPAKEQKKGGKPRKLTNQFNFCERAALTYNNPTRSQETQTVPPPMATFAANVLQWVIYDAYLEDYEQQQLEKELERQAKEKDKAPVSKHIPKAKSSGKAQLSEAVQGRVSECWKVLERMINQNTYDDIAKDYRYWNDPSDEFRDEEGTLLPLWKFTYDRTKKNTITDIEWNPYYYDLFAVCFGFRNASRINNFHGGVTALCAKDVYNVIKDGRRFNHKLLVLKWVFGNNSAFVYSRDTKLGTALLDILETKLDFMKPINEGAVCLFTLKNPSFPDYICITDSGVMCVDTHPKYPYMVVIGLYDGSVQVWNVFATCKEPAYRSNNVTNKHKGIVWEIKWAPDLPDGELNFFSVAADGKINNWVLMQNELAVTTIITLFLAKEEVSGPDGTLLKVKGCASCVKLHPKNPLIYLVGTEEGQIYKCSTAYSSMYLLTYNAHQMPVARIDFNKYNSDIFISCSGDWRIKVWEDNRLEPLFVFDVGDRVGDVKWAPYSSTVFAAVTTEGKVYVFDLNINKYKPICIQAVVSRKKNKLTRLSFNPKLPIMIVGDDKGCTTTLKLSPNLRIPCKAPKKQQHLDQWTLQCMKLDKLLSLVREPVTLTLPEDTAGSEES